MPSSVEKEARGRRERGDASTPSACCCFLLLVLVAALGIGSAHAEHCRGCVDGQPTETCPEPSRCGYQPILCVNCMAGMSMPECPNATWCTDIDCSRMQCIDRQPTPTCPDPGVCGYQPLLCTGCVPGAFRFSCPRSEWCAFNQTTPPCMDCMAGMAMPYCPDAMVCSGAGPAPSPPLPPSPPPPECDGCMAGMPMPHCPDPDACGARDSSVCVMSVVFSASGRTCLLFSAWHVESDAAQWLLVVVGIWLLAFMREGLTVYRTWAALMRRHEDVPRKLREANRASGPQPTPPVHPVDETSVALELPPTVHSRATQLRQPFMTPGGHLSDAALHSDGGGSEQQPAHAASSSTSLQFWDSVHYLLSLAFGYLLMLLIMTYNVWVCLLVLGGCAFWHFLLHHCLQKRWKPALMRRTQQALAQLTRHTNGRDSPQQQGANPPASAAAAAVKRLNAPTAPVSGEHCCDDLVFDD